MPTKPTRAEIEAQIERYSEVLALMDAGVIPSVTFFGASNRDKARAERAALRAYLGGVERDDLEAAIIEDTGIDPTADEVSDDDWDNLLYVAGDAWDWANGDYVDPDGEEVTPVAGWMNLRRDKPEQSNR